MRHRSLLAALLLVGCSEAALPGGSIDESLVTVFFPIDDDRVFLRGFSGATRAPFVYAVAHPQPIRPQPFTAVKPDGSFEIELIAESDDIIELSAAFSDDAKLRGPPIFLRVPAPANEDKSPQHCCFETNTCRSEFAREHGVPCRPYETGLTRCDEDADCFFLANEVLPIDVRAIDVSPPDEDARISIRGTVLPRSLVTIENRGLSSLGIGAPTWKRTTIADPEGTFSFENLPARGDDELVIQLRDLENLKSPRAQLIVPDPAFTSLEVVSVEGWEPIVEGLPGVVAIRVAPGGADGRGICPDSDEDPSTCFTGGLFHSMITSIDARLSRSGGGSSLAPRPAPIAEGRPHVVGAQGDVRDPARDYVIAIDMSADASVVDPDPPRRFAAARELVRRLRDRDRVGLVVIGGDGREVPIGPAAAVIAALTELSAEPTRGPRDLFRALGRAASHLRMADGARPGNVAVIMTGDVPGTTDDAIAHAAAVRTSLERRRVDIVTIGVNASGNLEALRRLARTGDPPGDVINLASIASLERAVHDLAHELVGSFILLYEIDVPAGVGKQDCVDLDLTAAIDGVSIETSFRGVVTFEGAAGDPSPCE